MAVDMFMKIDDIKGESADDKHKGEIDVYSWSWGATQTGSSQTAQGSGTGKANVSDLTFTTRLESSHAPLLGMLLKGKRWNRPRDEVGLALLVNGIGPQHRDYLAAGGLGFELGDGQLHYAPETTVETYYNLRLRKGINVTLDLQEVNNPGYNRDRGPIFFIGFRTHFEY